MDEEFLQKYIDHECSDAERAEAEQHLAFCEACRQRLATREKLYAEIKSAFNSFYKEEMEIPAFRVKPLRSVNRTVNILLYSLSAACMLLFALIIADHDMLSNQNEITIVQSNAVNVDANRPASDQEFVIEIYDGKGQRTEYDVK